MPYSIGKSEILKYVAKHWIKEKKVVHYFIHRPESVGKKNPLKLPFTMMLEYEFKNIDVRIKETAFKFGIDSLESFLTENSIESDHCICFDEVICKEYSTSFSKGLNEMKESVAAMWVAIGAKPVLGRFAIKALEKSGFNCPTLQYPLRNPLVIARNAHEVCENGAKNMLDGILQNPISLSSSTNIAQGQLIKVDEIQSSCSNAIMVSLLKIPAKKFALMFIDKIQAMEEILNEKQSKMNYENKSFVDPGFMDREEPIVVNESINYEKYQKWLCQPQTRKNDLIFLGTKHNCNGIQTEIVILVHPEPCQVPM